MSVAIPFRTHLDLGNNELQNTSLEKRSTPPATPADGVLYYDTVIQAALQYDQSRAKWLGLSPIRMEVGRTGTAAPGTSLRQTPDIPTSLTPLRVLRNMTLIAVTIGTSVAEQFVLRVDDVSGGSGATAAINYEAAGPTPTLNLIRTDLNIDFNAGDALDVYILSSATGNVSNPVVHLYFKLRK